MRLEVFANFNRIVLIIIYYKRASRVLFSRPKYFSNHIIVIANIFTAAPTANSQGIVITRAIRRRYGAA
jgi:hypothetical protein